MAQRSLKARRLEARRVLVVVGWTLAWTVTGGTVLTWAYLSTTAYVQNSGPAAPSPTMPTPPARG